MLFSKKGAFKQKFTEVFAPFTAGKAIAILSVLLIMVVLSITVFIARQQQSLETHATGTPVTAITTYQSIGLYWSPPDGSATNQCHVQYRMQGTTQWKQGYPLWYDARSVGGRTPEYRGSLVLLQPGTTYEIQLTLASGTSTTLTATTWTETSNLPIAQTLTVPSGSSPYTISQGGSPTGYILYTAGAGGSTIDVANTADNAVVIAASYVIVRGLTVRGGATNDIFLTNNVHHVVIENNDISGWGHYCNPPGYCGELDAGIRAADGGTFSQITVQRNKLHDPRANSNDYCEASQYGSNHPIGPRSVAFPDNATNNVFRYNDVWGDINHSYNDGMGENDNFSFQGFPNADTDINGNTIQNVMDDGLEIEGAGRNVRVWGNFVNMTHTGISSATDSVGPIYIFRNVYGYSAQCPRENGGYNNSGPHGPFGKLGDGTAAGGGRRYYFHNTLLQPGGQGGATAGPQHSGGPMTNTVSRDNIWHGWPTFQCIQGLTDSPTNDFDYDLCNTDPTEPHGIIGIPVYLPNNGDNAGSSGMYQLALNSPGYHAGIVIPNFDDDFGPQPDMGAQPSGGAKMEFGVTAYLTNPLPSVPQATSAAAPTPTLMLLTATATPKPQPTAIPTPIPTSSASAADIRDSQREQAVLLLGNALAQYASAHNGTYPANTLSWMQTLVTGNYLSALLPQIGTMPCWSENTALPVNNYCYQNYQVYHADGYTSIYVWARLESQTNFLKCGKYATVAYYAWDAASKQACLKCAIYPDPYARACNKVQ